jgi:hypothetical protein
LRFPRKLLKQAHKTAERLIKTPLVIGASFSLFNESSYFETSKFKFLSSVIINQDNFCSLFNETKLWQSLLIKSR